MNEMRYPVGTATFSELIEGGYAYVDKTKYIKPLTSQGKFIFLSRPRRFGKSLFLSTLESFFQGRRELFKGLAIDAPDTVWEERPVITTSLNTVEPHSDDALRKHLAVIFREYEEIYGIEDNDDGLASRFERILRRACEQTGSRRRSSISGFALPLRHSS